MKFLFYSFFILFANFGSLYSSKADDQQISDLFKKQSFKKLSLNYEWNGKSYLVHIVHNPLKEDLFCEQLLKPVQWPFCMTIAADQYLLAFARHLKSLVPSDLLSWWDSYWNLTVYNGDKISVTHSTYNWDHTYTPYSWYFVMLNAE